MDETLDHFVSTDVNTMIARFRQRYRPWYISGDNFGHHLAVLPVYASEAPTVAKALMRLSGYCTAHGVHPLNGKF